MSLSLSRCSVLLLLCLIACQDDHVQPGPPSSIEVLEGAGQVARVGTQLAIAPQIRVIDRRGRALPGVTVGFSVTTGFGSVRDAIQVTDSLGKARVGGWTLGTIVGEQKLGVQVQDLAVTTEITATATAGPPSGITALAPTRYAGLVGTTVTNPPSVLVSDQYGNIQAAATVTFEVIQGGGRVSGSNVTTDSHGIARVGSWTLGSTQGLNLLEARLPSGERVVFEAQALLSPPASMVAISPSAQPSGVLGFQVAETPRVQVRNAAGQPMYGIPVSFALTGGGDAAVSGTSDVTDANGIASLGDWKLGMVTTSSTVQASLPAFPGPKVTFTAGGTARKFWIDLQLLNRMAPDQRDAVVAAALRWMRVFTDSLPTVQINNLGAGRCGSGSPAFSGPVKNLLIFVRSSPIDGAGGVIASAGPCVRRTPSLHTAIGTMRLDSTDLSRIADSGQLFHVVLHEMGHVFGFGTSWTDKGLVTGIGGNDPRYTGAGALALWPTFQMNYGGVPIPLETLGGSGTRDVHWRKSVFGPELMTGYVEPAGVAMPMSKLTIAVLKDFGYSVDLNQADSYRGNLMAALLGSLGTSYPIIEDLSGPIYDVAASGELTPRR